MSLEEKSIHQLRAIAEGIGLPVDFSLDKTELLTKIRDAARPAAGFPVESTPDKEWDLTNPLLKYGDIHMLTRWMEQEGIVVTLEATTIRMTRRVGDIIKDDSCSLTAGNRTILQCARKLLEK